MSVWISHTFVRGRCNICTGIMHTHVCIIVVIGYAYAQIIDRSRILRVSKTRTDGQCTWTSERCDNGVDMSETRQSYI